MVELSKRPTSGLGTGFDPYTYDKSQKGSAPEPINKAEIYPCEYKVLVKLDPAEEVSEGGIVVSTGEQTEREEMAKVRGTLIDVGSRAFFDWPTKPQPGDRIMIAKFAGLFCEGYDGEMYRLCHDKDVAAVLGREKGGFTRDQRK